MQKKIGILLICLSAIVLLGLFSSWNYQTWRVIDWAAVIICGVSGLALLIK